MFIKIVCKKLNYNKIIDNFNKIKYNDIYAISKLKDKNEFKIYLDDIDWPEDESLREDYKIKQLIFKKKFSSTPYGLFGFNDKEIKLLHQAIINIHGLESVEILKLLMKIENY